MIFWLKNTLHTISITLTRKQRWVSIYWSYFSSNAAQKEKNKINHGRLLIIKAIGRYFSITLCITDFILTTHCQQHTKCVSPGKAVSANSVGLKYETRYNCYYHLQRDSLIVSIMEDILNQSMMSVTVWGGAHFYPYTRQHSF
jgi:hypothetical protein